MRSRRTVGTALVAVAFLAGCSSPGTSSPATAGGTAATPSATTPASVGPEAAPAQGLDASGELSPESGASETTQVADLAMFSSPSGNILCGVGVADGQEWARCDIADKEWTSPPQPADCPFDWGSSLDMDAEGARFACVSDAVGDPQRPLEYGRALQAGRLVCRSETSGMTCEHLDTGHGFSLARATYTLF